jgi:hypothetical protein
MAAKVKYTPTHSTSLTSTDSLLYMYQWTAHFQKICQNDMKNNSTVFCGLGHHFNGSKSNDSLFKVQNIYILPKNNLNKNDFRFSKVTSTNQKERRKSTSHAEGKILYFEVLKRSFDPAYGRQ